MSLLARYRWLSDYRWLIFACVGVVLFYAAVSLLLRNNPDARLSFGNIMQCVIPLFANAGLLANAGPLMIDAAEWSGLARGIAQRARVIEAVIADAYGPQRLLTGGHLDPALIFAHPAFLRPCHGIQPPGGRWLHVYAADLVRDASGAMVVIGDRAQAPSGAGYALENRIALSRALPEVYADYGDDGMVRALLERAQQERRRATASKAAPR